MIYTACKNNISVKRPDGSLQPQLSYRASNRNNTHFAILVYRHRMFFAVISQNYYSNRFSHPVFFILYNNTAV